LGFSITAFFAPWWLLAVFGLATAFTVHSWIGIRKFLVHTMRSMAQLFVAHLVYGAAKPTASCVRCARAGICSLLGYSPNNVDDAPASRATTADSIRCGPRLPPADTRTGPICRASPDCVCTCVTCACCGHTDCTRVTCACCGHTDCGQWKNGGFSSCLHAHQAANA